LEVVTKEWKIAISSLSIFILNSEKRKTLSVVDIYNKWSAKTNISVQSDELFNYLLVYISEVKDIDSEILREAILLDSPN